MFSTPLRRLALAAVSTLVTLLACDPESDDADRDALLEEIDEDEDEDDAPVAAELVAPSADVTPPPVPRDVDAQGLDLTAEIDPQGYIVKGWISEEGPALTCGTGQIASGFGCSGARCDNVGLECHNYGGSLGESSWSTWFSEEAPNNFFQCPGTQYVTGVTCSGGYCDNVSVECSDTGLAKHSCTWTPTWYSEEQGWYLTPGGQAIAGIWCSGGNCDNKRYLVCSTV